MPQNTNTLMPKAVNRSSIRNSDPSKYLNQITRARQTQPAQICFLAGLRKHSRNCLELKYAKESHNLTRFQAPKTHCLRSRTQICSETPEYLESEFLLESALDRKRSKTTPNSTQISPDSDQRLEARGGHGPDTGRFRVVLCPTWRNPEPARWVE
ncbi:hypothetical protein F511_37905 [Dorcoceras hygrometricum]|uniref:Uncharacterized protein n=1 Tax=Dorcoceras hygrometricum TaxID=472368 RepID=A0A2Z7A5V2_9LAMI|nr:hypothetical protein F511_37905 [Dorcoceras hygrometricum]